MGGDACGAAGASASGSPGGRNAWEAASLVCRIATVGLSLASAILTAASTKCLYRSDGSPAGAVSYSDYGSFKYSALANLLSAALQGVAIWLEVLGKEKWSKTVDLIDKLVLALTSTSAPLLLAVDNITSCGGSRRSRSVCDSQAGSFCRQLRLASLPSLGAVGFSVAVQYTRWRAARVDSVDGQTSERRRAGASPPPPPRGPPPRPNNGVAPSHPPPPPQGPTGNAPDGTSGGRGDEDGGGPGGGGPAQSQGNTSDTDPKGKGKSGESPGGGDDGGGDGPKGEGNKGEDKPGKEEIIVNRPVGEGRQMEGADPLPPVQQQKLLTGNEGGDGDDGNDEKFEGKMRYKTKQQKDKGNMGGEDKAGGVQAEDHREEEIQVEEAGPVVPPGGNVIVFRGNRG